MKKKLLTISLFFVTLLVLSTQGFAQWKCVLATQDDTPNGPSDQVPSVAVISDKLFVALVTRISIPAGQTVPTWDDVNRRDSITCNFLVGYSDPTDLTGRLGTVPGYGGALAGYYKKWISGFDEIKMYRAYKIVGTADSLVYVANNDPFHNILVFRLTKDSVDITDYRMPTDIAGTSGDAGDIMGLAVDNNGYVYVLNVNGSSGNTKEVKVYKGIKASGNSWATTHSDAPVQTIDLPTGVYRGLTVSPDGKQLFVSSMTDRNVVKYSGSPTTGYTKVTGFTFALSALDSIPRSMYFDSASSTNKWDLAKPLGMTYLSPNNLLFVTAARWLGNNITTHNSTSGYEYSKIFMLDPNNGARKDSFDVANYYFLNSDTTGVARSYTTQKFGEEHVSGYASLYDVAFDKNKDMYTQSFYSWTVDKWHYTGTLPTVVLGVREVSNAVPQDFALAQNYPNPFNPTTTIRFSVKSASHVELVVTNTLGQKVTTLVNEEVSAGTHEVGFDARTLSSGLYFYTLKAGNFIETKKMILTK